jgi:putative ABC transport system ATP-binding protein
MNDETIIGDEVQDDEIDIEGLEEVEYAVKMDDVSRVYSLGKREITAIQKVDLQVRSGEFVVVSGHSGSGKTTLLNLIGAIDFATTGKVRVMDVPIGDYDESFRATFRLTNTGYIFQSYNLISTLTALENVMFPMQLTDRDEAELRAEAMALLERVGLSDRHDHLPWQLSSGEQQRVAVVRAMANDPPIILADEPTANLDAESASMLRGMFKDLNDAGKTLIVMTHDEELIRMKGVRHLHMDKGVLSDNV